MSKYFIIFFLISSIICIPSCTEGEKFCKKCNLLTGLCLLCENDAFIPDDDGGCFGSRTCKIDSNYCEECSSNKKICEKCEEGYYPDKNGGCSLTPNCEISYEGECKSCKSGFVLIGVEGILQICKSLASEDFNNCKEFNQTNGKCEVCEEGYYLNTLDKKCSESKNCEKSKYGKCISCSSGYYLDHKEKNNTNKCKSYDDNKEKFIYCKEVENGKTCTKCEEGYYFDIDNICVTSNFCYKSKDNYCEECIKGYYLSDLNNVCTTEKKCLNGDKDSGVCNLCKTNYYLDANDRKCKSNLEDDDLKYCDYFTDKCESCEISYYLGEDNKCSNTKYCLKSENGICNKCQKNYHLTRENICSDIKYCKSASSSQLCLECEDGFYFNRMILKCSEAVGDFKNCKISDLLGMKCGECKKDYYLSPEFYQCNYYKNETIFYGCALSNYEETFCEKCEKGYYLGKDKRCSKSNNCKIAEKGECIKCIDDYILDKNDICINEE